MTSFENDNLENGGRVSQRAFEWLTGLYWISLFISTHWPKVHLAAGTSVMHVDKLLHFLTYCGLACVLFCCWGIRLSGQAASPSRAVRIVVILGMLALYGIVDELTQPLVGRSLELTDWLADMSGATLGLAVCAAVAAAREGLWARTAK